MLSPRKMERIEGSEARDLHGRDAFAHVLWRGTTVRELGEEASDDRGPLRIRVQLVFEFMSDRAKQLQLAVDPAAENRSTAVVSSWIRACD